MRGLRHGPEPDFRPPICDLDRRRCSTDPVPREVTPGSRNWSTTTRNLTAGIDPATFTEVSSQTTEDQIGLDKGQRRDVQRRLTGLGFDTKITGKFDEPTRAVITRWQAARGYPKSGYLNKLQHKALLTEIVSATTSASSSDDEDRPRRRSGGGGGGRQHSGGGGGPNPGAAFIGGVVGGMLR